MLNGRNRIYFLVIALFCTMFSCIFCINSNDEQFNYNFNLLRNYYASHEYIKALVPLEVVINLIEDPEEKSIFLFVRSKIFYKIGDYNSALLNIQNSLNLKLNKELIEQENIYYVMILDSLKMETKANVEMEKLEAAVFFDSEEYRLRSELYFQRKDYEKAYDDIEQAISLNPKSAINYITKARFLEKSGSLNEALNTLNSGIIKTLNNPFSKGSEMAFDLSTAYLYKAILHYKNNEFNEAIVNLKIAKEVNDDFHSDLKKWFLFRDFNDNEIKILERIVNEE